MKGTEKKGFFGRLFGRKEEEKQEAVKAPETRKTKTVKPPETGKATSPKAEKPARPEAAAEKKEQRRPAKPAATSDAVELEMDIPEEDFATVAISASDLVLEADLKEEESSADAPQESLQGDDEQTDVSSQVVARQYGFPEYTDEKADLPPAKDAAEYVIRDTMEIKESAPVPAALRETVRIDRREAEEALKEARKVEEPPPEEPDVEPAVIDEEIVVDRPEAPIVPVGIKDVARVPGGDSPEAFGVEKSSQVLARFIETCQTPFNVAIHGEAGCGKTTFMKMTAFNLADSEVIPLWLNAWDYCKIGFADTLPFVLIRHIISRLQTVSGDNEAQSSPRIVEAIKLLNTAGGTRFGLARKGGEGAKTDRMPESAPIADLCETVPRVKTALQELVSSTLESKGRSRVVVFIDDLERLEPARATDLLECLNLFLQQDGLVFVAACALDTVSCCPAGNLDVDGDGPAANSLFRKVFQLSLDVRSMEFNRKGYLRELLDRANLNGDDRTLGRLPGLLETSVGFNPRVMKGLVNDLAFLATMRQAMVSGEDDGAEQPMHRQVVFFGILCLQRAFPRVFRHLLANVGNEAALSDLLEDGLRNERNVLKLDLAHSILDGNSPREEAASRLVGFVDLLLDCFDAGSCGKKLSPQEKGVIKEGVKLAALTDSSGATVRDSDSQKGFMREFCWRVRSRLARIVPGLAPDASSGDLRNWPSARPWFALWYGDQEAKRAWERGHVFFELGFKGPDRDTVAISLKCNTPKVLEVGVAAKAIEDLKMLPILEEEDFELHDRDGGWIEITKELKVSGLGAAGEISQEDVENVAEELKDLVEAAHALFDVAVPTQGVSKPREQKASTAKPTCKTCGAHLERVRLKDGSLSYVCRPCGKTYKVKGAASS